MKCHLSHIHVGSHNKHNTKTRLFVFLLIYLRQPIDKSLRNGVRTVHCTQYLAHHNFNHVIQLPRLSCGRRCTQDPSLSVPSRIDLLFIVFSALSSSRPNYTRHASDTTSTQNAVRLPIRERIAGRPLMYSRHPSHLARRCGCCC